MGVLRNRPLLMAAMYEAGILEEASQQAKVVERQKALALVLGEPPQNLHPRQATSRSPQTCSRNRSRSRSPRHDQGAAECRVQEDPDPEAPHASVSWEYEERFSPKYGSRYGSKPWIEVWVRMLK